MNFTSNQLSIGKSERDGNQSNVECVSEDVLKSGHTHISDNLEQDLATAASSSQVEGGYWKHRNLVRARLRRQTYDDSSTKTLTAPHLQALTQLVENYCEAIEETTLFTRAKAIGLSQQSIARAGMKAEPNQKEILAMIAGTDDAMDSTALKKRQLLLAESPSASVDILVELASSSFSEVREAVADHSQCPISIQLMLADDEYIEVRYALAENHNMPFQVLEKLTQDDNPYVANRAERTMRRVLFNNVICMEVPGDDDEDEQITAIG